MLKLPLFTFSFPGAGLSTIIQQTTVDNSLITDLKNYASDHGLKQQEIYVKAFDALMKDIRNADPSKIFVYFSAPLDGVNLSMRIPESVKRDVELAAAGRASCRTFYYTALVRFLNNWQ